jgi:pimeloyl-ACP methyl ester carboxylesterase
VVGKLKTAIEVLREHWRVARAPPNRGVYGALAAAAPGGFGKGFAAYLEDFPARGKVEALGDWRRDASGEFRLRYSSSFFAQGCLRVRPGGGRGTLVFLPGNLTGADEVFKPGAHRAAMTELADSVGMALACWDWPLQGSRLEGCLYAGLGSLYSAEREYSRFLPALGTCLWREFVAELAFALPQVRRQVGGDGPMHVVGWSMGACFAYVAPLLCDSVATTLAAGSCARVSDLVAEGETRRHGFWFYPMEGLRYFDLDGVVDSVIASGRPVRIVHGDRDPGCLPRTRAAMAERARASGGLLTVEVLPGHGHVLSPEMKARIRHHLEAGAVR